VEADEVFDQAVKAAGAAILPIMIESQSAAVQSLPWETLYHPLHGFLGRNPAFTLARRMEAGQTASPTLEKGPLRVLLFTALPDDVNPETGRLNVEEEQAQVQEALLPWIAKGLVQLEMPDDGRFSTLKELLSSFQPHLLFLSGHGRFHHQPPSGEPPYGEFLFESATGACDLVRGDQLALACIGTDVQAVVLSACETSKAASDALNNGLTQRLSAQGIPHVIGMRESILEQAGIQFARVLCDELAKKEHIDFALQAARTAILTPLKEKLSGPPAELSYGQWCLPMLLSSRPEQPLIDWDFQPQPFTARPVNLSLQTISLPARFVGRRAEMRQFKRQIQQGKLQKLLITGPGGQGKTALAGKLALDLERQGDCVFAWSARPENRWQPFQFEMEMSLSGNFAATYDRMMPKSESEGERAVLLLRLLLQQNNGRLVLFLDNLESLQDPVSLVLKDSQVAAWLQAAQSLPGVVVLATSRWQLPGWLGEHLALTHASYGDFLQMAQQLALGGQLPRSFLEKREQLRQVYTLLGGNGRGLEFFAAALCSFEGDSEEKAFLESLAHAQAEMQVNMAIAEIYQRLPVNAQTLLSRLTVYPQPVPVEGILKLGLDLSEAPEGLLARLLAVSLVEAQVEPDWEVIQYQCTPLAADWLQENHPMADAPVWLNAAADFQVYLHRYERRTLGQAITAHAALRRAGRKTQADRLALDYIVGPRSRAGFFRLLLSDWLPDICQSNEPAIRGEALGQTGKQYLSIGDYATALDYLLKSLTIRQQIGDKAGEGTTLNNISQVYKAQGDYATALDYLLKSLTIMQQIGDKAGEGTTLNNISQIYDAQGDYATALDYLLKSLTIMQQIGDKAGEGTTLNNISQIYDAQGDYATALDYLLKSLTIRQQIGDKAGLCATLFNLGHIYVQKNEIQEAVSAWVTAYRIAKQIGLSQGLQALAQLAPQLGLPPGLEGWEKLAQRFRDQA
jgi:tetratricopeptide (TPR) repeat protein